MEIFLITDSAILCGGSSSYKCNILLFVVTKYGTLSKKNSEGFDGKILIDGIQESHLETFVSIPEAQVISHQNVIVNYN